ncbi:hypothetical protein AB5J52_07385 [Streptomyces sp. R39]|uniref:Benenodin family lasso peptide n=1 Tax=Streptomyces sp. R39 TaxID=3238631 RepID=A0AB39QKP6_9ACTN
MNREPDEQQNDDIEVEELLDDVAGGRFVGGTLDPIVTTDVI